MRYALATLAVLAAACSPQQQAPAAPPQAPAAEALTSEGWGPLRIGMSRADVVAALGDREDPNAVGGPEPESCDEFHPARAPQGLYVMILDGALSRITLAEGATLKTDHNLGVGDRAEAVRAAYPDARSEPHHYQEAPAAYVTAWTSGASAADYVEDEAARGVRYEIGSGGVVEYVHAGGPSIQFVEGCA